jgi:hypothetical protein
MGLDFSSTMLEICSSLFPCLLTISCLDNIIHSVRSWKETTFRLTQVDDFNFQCQQPWGFIMV